MSDPMTPTGAGALLDSAALARGRAMEAVTRSATPNGRFLCLFGALFGGLAIAVGLTAHGSGGAIIMVMSAFVVCLQLLVYFRESTRTGAALGATVRNGVALGLTGGLYVVAVVLAAGQLVTPAAWVWVLGGVVVATPAVIAGILQIRAS